jgi:hypothetical protein
MFHIVNCTEMPTAYEEGNYILQRAVNQKLLSMSNTLALRPVGSLQNNQDYPANSKQLNQEIRH